MGQETLQRAVDVAQETVGVEVICGDTNSIMINTRITDPSEWKAVEDLGEKVKKEVNRLCKTLELEIDGILCPMLLLKKKKYASVVVEKGPNG
jgi:DNA polymerase alpha subunit A